MFDWNNFKMKIQKITYTLLKFGEIWEENMFMVSSIRLQIDPLKKSQRKKTISK